MLRFAPSQTEDLSINSLRIAIFNYILSKQLNEDLVVRINDTDRKNNIEGKDKEILELLNLFSIEFKNALHQSDSLKYHQKLAMQLMTQKKAFSCFCSDEKLNELKEKAKAEGKKSEYDGFCQTLSDETVLNTNAPFTVRIKKPEENIFGFTADEIDSFIILNHDKTPTYNYACAIDDMLMNISTVIREKENILNTPKQIHIRNQFGYDNEINYIHISSFLDEDNITVKKLIEDGYLPSAIANYLVLVGNSTPNEIFTLEEAISWFDIEKLSKESLKFDIKKLKEINKKHIETLDEMRLSKILGFADDDIGKLGKLFLEEATTINEIKERIAPIFTAKTSCEGFEEEFKTLKETLKNAPYFENYEDLVKYIKEKTGLENEKISKPLRYILTGRENGVDICKIYSFIKNYLGEIVR